ncbi:MAG: polymer-forming cytoskeletal protein [Bryobacteraceae bacterium]
MRFEAETGAVFRELARTWLASMPPGESGEPRVFQSGTTQVVLAEDVSCSDGMELDEVLLVRGRFECGAQCQFRGPIYVAGDAVIGKGSQVDAICADGNLVVGLGVQVRRAECAGWMDLRAGAWVDEGVAEAGIRLSDDAGGAGLMAPEIVTLGHWGANGAIPPVRSYLEINPPGRGERPQLLNVRGYRDDKLTPLGAETWVYDGSLTLPQPVMLRGNLVVRGSFSCPAGSLLEGDIKAGGDIRIGQGSISRGNLIARGLLELGEDCLFEGDLRSTQTLRLSSGVRGARKGGPVRVESGEELLIEPNVVIRGQLSAPKGAVSAPVEIEGGLELLLVES